MTDRLNRFTPNAPGLDRDAILFAAGRRSARGSWLWKVAVAVLAASQALTLVVLWPAPAITTSRVPPPVLGPAAQPEPLPPSPPSDVWTAGSQPDVLLRSEPLAAIQFVPSGPPLTARSTIPDL